MDTCNKISKFMMKNNYECRVMGIPKTIDNDLFGTDHCPGYASAAKYIATSCMELYHDARVYDTGMVTVLEIMGRHAGWLAAAASLASARGQGPDLIYLPETDFDLDDFLAKVNAIYQEQGKCIVAVSEGIHDKDGKFISEYGSERRLQGFFRAHAAGRPGRHAGQPDQGETRRQQGARHRIFAVAALRGPLRLQNRCG